MAELNVPAIFHEACRLWTPKLRADFGFDALDVAAILGNAGHESNGLRAMQEVAPRAGRGGLGAFQWTGPRRRAFEAYLARSGAAPEDLDASYAFLAEELKGAERKAVAETKAADGLEAKVRAFERSFERAGVKHYPSRIAWAKRAHAILREMPDEGPSRPTIVATLPRTAPASLWERLVGMREPAVPAVGRNRGDATLFRAQNRLLAAGYTEVGDPDGLWGPNTKGAVDALLREQFPAIDPPRDWPLSDAILAAVAKAGRRPVAAERAAITVGELRARGSTPIKAPVSLVGGGGLLSLLGLGKALDEAGLTERIAAVSAKASEVADSVAAVTGALGGIVGIVTRFWWLILPALGLWWMARGLKWALEIRALVRQGSIRQTSL